MIQVLNILTWERVLVMILLETVDGNLEMYHEDSNRLGMIGTRF